MADEEIDNAEAPCLACGGTLREGVAQPRTTYAERGRFSIRECVTCGLGRTSPTLSPSELECFYSGQYGYDVHALVSAEKRWRARRIGKTLALDGVTSALDVGCMYGYLLEELRAQGVARVEGVELARHPVEQARRRGLSVYCGTLETYAETRRDPFDLIIAQHVLEHVPNPHSFLRTAASLLNTGGRLVICVPNSPPECASGSARRGAGTKSQFISITLHSLLWSVFCTKRGLLWIAPAPAAGTHFLC